MNFYLILAMTLMMGPSAFSSDNTKLSAGNRILRSENNVFQSGEVIEILEDDKIKIKLDDSQNKQFVVSQKNLSKAITSAEGFKINKRVYFEYSNVKLFGTVLEIYSNRILKITADDQTEQHYFMNMDEVGQKVKCVLIKDAILCEGQHVSYKSASGYNTGMVKELYDYFKRGGIATVTSHKDENEIRSFDLAQLGISIDCKNNICKNQNVYYKKWIKRVPSRVLEIYSNGIVKIENKSDKAIHLIDISDLTTGNNTRHF